MSNKLFAADGVTPIVHGLDGLLVSAVAYNRIYREVVQLRAAEAAQSPQLDGPEYEDGSDSDGFKGPRPWNNYAAPAASQVPGHLPDVLFDSHSVLKALTELAARRTRPENVDDVLDAVVRLLRVTPAVAQAPFSGGKGAGAKVFDFGTGECFEEQRPNSV